MLWVIIVTCYQRSYDTGFVCCMFVKLPLALLVAFVVVFWTSITVFLTFIENSIFLDSEIINVMYSLWIKTVTIQRVFI